MKRRVIVYGDMHGCLEELKKLRKKIYPKQNDIEVSVGDILNKGPLNIDTLRYVQKHNIWAVMGNNEEKILNYYKKYKKDPKKILSKMRDDEREIVLHLNNKDIQFLKNLPYYIKIKNLTIVHAGIKIGTKLNASIDKEDKKWLTLLRFYNKEFQPIPYSDKINRFVFWSDIYSGRDGFVVFGHHPFSKSKISKHAIGIDTGCVYGGKLSAVVFEFDGKKVDTKNYKIYSQKASKKYWN